MSPGRFPASNLSFYGISRWPATETRRTVQVGPSTPLLVGDYRRQLRQVHRIPPRLSTKIAPEYHFAGATNYQGRRDFSAILKSILATHIFVRYSDFHSSNF